MSVSPGNSAQQSHINVTPLIDVLLVLLIIFMVIVPVSPIALSAAVPKQTSPSESTSTEPAVIVLDVQSHESGAPTYRINQQEVAKKDLLPRLVSALSTRPNKVLFVKGDAALSFESIAEAISLGHAASAETVGILTPRT